MTDELAGKIILITGASGGIGLEAARALARRGATTLLTARSYDRARAAADAVGYGADAFALDVTSPASIRDARAAIAERYERIDVAINNAGVVSGKRAVTAEGVELTWATNVLGPYRVTHEFLPLLRAAEMPRVVDVGSNAHRASKIAWDDLQFERRRYRGFFAYAQSKLALMLLTRAWAREEPWLATNCVHPGAIATGIWRDAPGPVRAILARVLPSPERGAIPLTNAAVSPALAGVSGRFLDGVRECEPSVAARSRADANRLWSLVGEQTGLR